MIRHPAIAPWARRLGLKPARYDQCMFGCPARAGVEVWPKPFQNLRSSRQTELEQEHPTYVVCEWLGNTPGVAFKHYLTVTDDDYQKAVQNGG